MCGCGRRGKCSSFYLLNLQQELQRLCAKDTEVKVIEVVVPGLFVATLICIDGLRIKEQNGNVEGMGKI